MEVSIGNGPNMEASIGKRLLINVFFLVFFLVSSPQRRVDGLFFGSADKEVLREATDEARNMPHLDPIKDDDLKVGGEHFDEKAFLGSSEQAELFSEKNREEQEKGLRALFPKIDEDGNGTISKAELTKWIQHSISTLKSEEAKNRFPHHDYDEDGKFTWDDHLYSVYGFVPTEQELKDGVTGVDPADAADHLHQLDLFRAADVDRDNELTYEEFKAFFRPEDYPHTQEIEAKNILRQHDTDKDGGLNVQEFLKAELNENDDKEWINIETERFHNNWDVNKDGVLKDAEVRAWWMPSNDEVAKEEVEHLFGVADDNKDERLSVDEIVAHLDTFVGSQATNYGQHLKDEL